MLKLGPRTSRNNSRSRREICQVFYSLADHIASVYFLFLLKTTGKNRGASCPRTGQRANELLALP